MAIRKYNPTSPGVRGKTSLTFTVVVQTPTTGAQLSVNPRVQGKESTNDQNNGHTDVFQASLTWTLTSDTKNAITSYTNPAATTGAATFSTDKNLCFGAAAACGANINPQWTEAHVPNGLAPFGALVSLSERDLVASDCPSFITTKNKTCFAQVSAIAVGSSGSGGVFRCTPPVANPVDCANSLVFTVRVAAAVLDFKQVNFNREVVSHNGANVPLCSTGTDPSGDCLKAFFQDDNGDLVWTAVGPANGNWLNGH